MGPGRAARSPLFSKLVIVLCYCLNNEKDQKSPYMALAKTSVGQRECHSSPASRFSVEPPSGTCSGFFLGLLLPSMSRLEKRSGAWVAPSLPKGCRGVASYIYWDGFPQGRGRVGLPLSSLRISRIYEAGTGARSHWAGRVTAGLQMASDHARSQPHWAPWTGCSKRGHGGAPQEASRKPS